MSVPSFLSFPDLEPDPPEPAKSSRSKEKKKSSDHKERKAHKRKHRSEPEHVESHKHDESLRYFYSDRKGDPLNIQYNGLHRGDVPKYHWVARGRQVLGLPGTIISRTHEGIHVGTGKRRKIPGLTDPKTRALLAATPRPILSSSDTYKYKEKDGFLPLPSRRKDPQSYRSITRAEANSDADSDSSKSEQSDGEDDSSSDEIVLTYHQSALKSLEQALTKDPSSIANWISLLSRTLSTVPITSKNYVQARSEITISIISRAFSVFPGNLSSKILRLRYLKAGENIWHESKLKAEWEDAFKVGGIELWMEWLEWRIAKEKDGINGVIEAAMRVLEALGNQEEAELSKVRVFWRVAVACQQAGFTERATAMFQAQAELTFEVPQSFYGLPLKSQLDELEEFWESEVPRTGEQGAQGWARWISSGRPESSPTSSHVPLSSEPADSDPFRRWAYEEAHADRNSCFSSRSSDSDPYATILFSDIRPLLISLSSSRAKDAFRMAWLSVLGLQVPGFSASLSASQEINWDDRWSSTHLLGKTYLQSILPEDGLQRALTTDARAGVLVGREKEYSSSFGPVKCWRYGVMQPLEGFFGTGSFWGDEDVKGLDQDLINRVFVQLRVGIDDHEWDTLALAFQAATSLKSALKLSRSFLSVARDSVPHWGAHASLERMRGRPQESRKVYQTVLVASTPVPTTPGVCHLWWDWAEMEWLLGNDEEALSVSLRASGVEGREGIAILRAKRNLDDLANTALSPKERESWTKTRGLLELLVSKDPAAALAVFDNAIERDAGKTWRTGSAHHESILVASLLMVYRHGTILKRPVKSALLRERVETALELYPSNSIILGLFLEGEKGQGVWGRVRAALGDSLGREKGVYRKVEEVWIANWEKGRWEGEIERIRSGLTIAVDNDRTKGSYVLWRIFLEFEIRAGQLHRAKKLLFRAIGECPLIKELYLLAFLPLRSVFSPQELNGFADTMAERGIRVRRGLDEVLQGQEDVGAGNADDSESDNDNWDEIERNAQELRRLRPY